MIVDIRILAGLESPLLRALSRVERVEMCIPTSDVQNTIGNCGRRMHDISGVKFPLQRARSGVNGIDVAIAAAEVNRAAPNARRREIEIPGIGHALSRRLQMMEMCSRVALL